jgi:uncharacterized phage protein gp47/JayE
VSLQTPTTKEIYQNIIAQLESSLNQSIPLLPKSFLRVLAKALAGVFVLLYKYGGFVFLQMFVSTASAKNTEVNGVIINPLRLWGELVGIGAPTAATSAELLIEIEVTALSGVLPSNTQLVNSDNGVTYITVGAVLLNAATVPATILAVSDQAGGGGVGVIGNLSPGAVVSFANPLGTVDRNAVVTAQLVTGADAESEANYRQRILDKFQKRPQGGAYADYQQWGQEAAGIINVYPYTGDPGQVNVYSEATVESSGSPDGIPTVAQLQAVLDIINLDENGRATRRNANAFVNSLAITRTSFDVEVTGIADVNDLAEVQENITTALTQYFFAAEPFIEGLSIPPRLDRLTNTRVASLVEDIVTAAGGVFTSSIFFITSVPGSLTSYTLSEGEKSKITNVTFF